AGSTHAENDWLKQSTSQEAFPPAVRNRGLRPVRQADILSAFSLHGKRSATPLGAQTWRSMFRSCQKEQAGSFQRTTFNRLPNILPPSMFTARRLRTAEQDARPPKTDAQSNLLRRSRHSLLFNENCRRPLSTRC